MTSVCVCVCAGARTRTVRSKPVGRYREAELLPQAGGGAPTGHSLTTGLHQRRATQPHDSAVSL